MLFNSWQFLLFMIIIFVGYWAIRPQYRYLFLLAGSLAFYASWGPEYLIYLALTVMLTYCSGLLLEILRGGGQTLVLITTVLLAVGALIFFKYTGFFADILYKTFSVESPLTVSIVAPIGFSFYLFQALGYVIDVYRKKYKPEKNLARYALFVSFFPQVISGPIGRGRDLLPQFHGNVSFQYEGAMYGVKQFCVGLFKKMVLSNTLGMMVNSVYGNVHGYKGFVLVTASILYMIQIYCDFSGYSDMAIGCARLLGIELKENFNLPYFSKSIREFWRRWHISLSSWFKDYLYIPLGGNRKGPARKRINILLTFLVSGLWHGANYTYVVWGALHGMLQVLEDIFTGGKNKTGKSHWLIDLLKHVCVLCLLLVTWIFFRAESVSDAFYVLTNMLSGIGNMEYLKAGISGLGMDKVTLATTGASILVLVIIDSVSYVCGDVIEKVSNMKLILRWSIYIIFVIMIIVFTPAVVSTEFIYFQF